MSSSLLSGSLDSTIDLMSEMTKLSTMLITSGNFGKAQGQLVKRTKEIIGEMEKSCVLLKKDCIFFDDMSTKFQVERVKLQDELIVVKKERDDLTEKVTRLEEDERRLRDDERIASERVKRLEERLGKACEEQSRMRIEKKEMMSELNVKVTNLKSQVLEKDQMLNNFRERLKCMEINEEILKNQVCERDQMLRTCKERMRIVEVEMLQREQEVRDLKHQITAAYEIIEKLMLEQTEAEKKAEELRRQSMEASANTEKFKKLYLAVERDKLKADDKLKDIKEKQLEVDKHVEEVRGEKLVALQAVKEFKEWTLAADESFEVNKEMWEGSPRIKTVEEGLIRILKIKVLELANSVLEEAVDVNSLIPKGSRESLRMGTWINEGSENDNDSLDQVGSQFHNSPPQVETSSSADREKGTKKSHISGIIVAEDSVEVARPGEAEYRSDLLFTPVPRRKRSSLGNTDGNLPNKRQKKEPTREPSQENNESESPSIKSNRCKEKVAAASNSQTQTWTSSSDSEDESCSDSHMNKMVRIVRFEKIRETWKSESDMLKVLQKDLELCMDAVCVLYRWKIRESELPHFEVMGGSALAKYLINGDPDFRLRKFVSEVEKERPDSFVQCRKIAASYSEKLFSIYRNRNDPFFR